MTIDIKLVKELRGQTGVSIMQCKIALEEAEGDLEKAKIALTKKSGEIAAKKGDRELGSGVVVFVENNDKSILLELGCETDFVANNEEFAALAKKIAVMVTENGEDDSNITNEVSEGTQKFGERIDLVRTEVSTGNIGHYVHVNNSVGAIVEFDSEVTDELGKDVAMHIAAQHPRYLAESDVDAGERQKAEETLREEVQDKPAEMQEKILEGKLNSFFKERVLLTQGFIKDPSQTIGKLVENAGNKIVKYTRFGVGEV